LALFLIIIIRYDASNSHAYIGDSAGQITIMTVTAETSHKVDTMKKHTGRHHLNCFFWLLNIAYNMPVTPGCHFRTSDSVMKVVLEHKSAFFYHWLSLHTLCMMSRYAVLALLAEFHAVGTYQTYPFFASVAEFYVICCLC